MPKYRTYPRTEQSVEVSPGGIGALSINPTARAEAPPQTPELVSSGVHQAMERISQLQPGLPRGERMQLAERSASAANEALVPAFNPVSDVIMGLAMPGTALSRLGSAALFPSAGYLSEYVTERVGPKAGAATAFLAAPAAGIAAKALRPSVIKYLLGSERGSISFSRAIDPETGDPIHVFQEHPTAMRNPIHPLMTGGGLKEATSLPPLDNPNVRRLSAAFEASGGRLDLNQLEQDFNASVQRNPTTMKSAFDELMDYARSEVAAKGKPLQGRFQPGTIDMVQRYQQGVRANRKIGSAVVSLDTSRGCPNFCSQCYMRSKFAKPGETGIDVSYPASISFVGDARKVPDKKVIFRVGVNGEPSYDPTKGYFHWDWTVNQLKAAHLDDPKIAARTYVNTKLNTVDGFDPSVIRNLFVSVDPLNPEHFFNTLRNVDAVREIDPTVNIVLRILSLNSRSDEINALQKIAVDFANSRDLPVLETRLRFKGSVSHPTPYRSYTGLATVRATPEYSKKGYEYKDFSYFAPTKQNVYASSPLSRFGINRHEVCNWPSRVDDACATCGNCKKLITQGYKPFNPLLAGSPRSSATAVQPTTP
jgi:hypothetical protein